jgi:hypothetical protein
MYHPFDIAALTARLLMPRKCAYAAVVMRFIYLVPKRKGIKFYATIRNNFTVWAKYTNTNRCYLILRT